ncbi:GIY-YIG nuclease family protein [Aquihabitans sp. McL0605]|uniref:GIY-YIG nuclease family protein n=1 Tax=Aquihabitans sp. McL0605 TaxID=3415671 RepID=UPI003CF42BF7
MGKAERSLVSRDVATHYGTGKTGHSTLRRSVGALLADQLGLVAQPRNLAKPAYFSSFAFEPKGDAQLTQWMLEHLRLATWAPQQPVVLDDVETEVLRALLPPLNLDKVRTPWRPLVSSRRRSMAAQARLWTP